jgi:hypothetical protein
VGTRSLLVQDEGQDEATVPSDSVTKLEKSPASFDWKPPRLPSTTKTGNVGKAQGEDDSESVSGRAMSVNDEDGPNKQLRSEGTGPSGAGSNGNKKRPRDFDEERLDDWTKKFKCARDARVEAQKAVKRSEVRSCQLRIFSTERRMTSDTGAGAGAGGATEAGIIFASGAANCGAGMVVGKAGRGKGTPRPGYCELPISCVV